MIASASNNMLDAGYTFAFGHLQTVRLTGIPLVLTAALILAYDLW